MLTASGFLNYNIYRRDRYIHTSLQSRSGGVLIAIRYNIYSKLIKIKNNNVEMLFLLV